MTKQLFSNGTEYEIWAANNCNVCLLSINNNGQGDECLKPRCKIEAVIFDAMVGIETTPKDHTNVHGGNGGHCVKFTHVNTSKRITPEADKLAVRNFWMVR